MEYLGRKIVQANDPYVITVNPSTEAGLVSVSVDGEQATNVSGFEIEMPVGGTTQIRKIMKIVLEPAEK